MASRKLPKLVGTIVSTSKSGCFLNLTGRAQNISDFKHCLGSSDNSRILCCELKHISCLFTPQAHSLTLTDDGSPAQVTSDANQTDNSNLSTVAANKQRLTIDISAVRTLEVVPIVSPTSISIDKAGLPLAIFTKVRVFYFYVPGMHREHAWIRFFIRVPVTQRFSTCGSVKWGHAEKKS